MEFTLSPAGPADEDLVTRMMQEFYAIEHLRYDEAVARGALRQLHENPALGRVYLLRHDGEAAGYVVLTFGFSLEFGGRFALIDELYVREPCRGRGIGTKCLHALEEVCHGENIQTLRLEVDRANAGARQLYDRVGYTDHDRDFLTRRLTRPAASG